MSDNACMHIFLPTSEKKDTAFQFENILVVNDDPTPTHKTRRMMTQVLGSINDITKFNQ